MIQLTFANRDPLDGHIFDPSGNIVYAADTPRGFLPLTTTVRNAEQQVVGTYERGHFLKEKITLDGQQFDMKDWLPKKGLFSWCVICYAES